MDYIWLRLTQLTKKLRRNIFASWIDTSQNLFLIPPLIMKKFSEFGSFQKAEHNELVSEIEKFITMTFPPHFDSSSMSLFCSLEGRTQKYIKACKFLIGSRVGKYQVNLQNNLAIHFDYSPVFGVGLKESLRVAVGNWINALINARAEGTTCNPS